MKRRTLELWALAVVFLGPLAAAFVLYFGPWDLSFLPRVPVEGRELLTPPPALPPLALSEEPDAGRGERRWLLIYATMAPCEERCAAEWDRLARVHAALGRDAARVRLVLLHGGQGPPAAEPRAAWGRLGGGVNEAAVAALGAARIGDGTIFVVDPLGNVVVAYPGNVGQRDLLEDLERLLDVSRIG
ncbi:MAG TPA: hypothetical protein VIN61_10065 [Gammaproteobacteria bacterium]